MIFFVVGCQFFSSEFEREKLALDAFEKFESEREQRNWAEAHVALEKAIRYQPDMRNLRNWEVYLYYEKGEYRECSDKATQYLLKMPGDGNMRYNLAACLAQEGRFDESARHLKILIQDGRAHPVEVAEDPDFELMIGKSEYADVVQKPELAAGIVTAPKSMLLGDTETIRVKVRYRSTEELSFGGKISDDFRILKVSQTNMDSDDHMAMSQIDLQIEALKSGDLLFANLEIKTTTQSVTLPEIEIEAIELNQTLNSIKKPVRAFMPSIWLTRNTPPFSEPIIIEDTSLIIVSAPPNADIAHTGVALQMLEFWEDKKMKFKGLVITPANTTAIEIKYEDNVLHAENYIYP